MQASGTRTRSALFEQVVTATADYVQALVATEPSGHDWWQLVRVRQLAETIARQEGADLFICQMAALLHDLADKKFNPSLEAGLKKVAAWLDCQAVPDEDKAHILEIIATMSYSSQQAGAEVPSLEGRIVRDADRLDAMGAIGIARTMAYSGHVGRLIYHPYAVASTAIGHFDEKLLHLKDLMTTATAKALAESRHRFLEAYLDQFYKEWSGQA